MSGFPSCERIAEAHLNKKLHLKYVDPDLPSIQDSSPRPITESSSSSSPFSSNSIPIHFTLIETSSSFHNRPPVFTTLSFLYQPSTSTFFGSSTSSVPNDSIAYYTFPYRIYGCYSERTQRIAFTKSYSTRLQFEYRLEKDAERRGLGWSGTWVQTTEAEEVGEVRMWPNTFEWQGRLTRQLEDTTSIAGSNGGSMLPHLFRAPLCIVCCVSRICAHSTNCECIAYCSLCIRGFINAERNARGEDCLICGKEVTGYEVLIERSKEQQELVNKEREQRKLGEKIARDREKEKPEIEIEPIRLYEPRMSLVDNSNSIVS